jgi:hypothetical protein
MDMLNDTLDNAIVVHCHPVEVITLIGIGVAPNMSSLFADIDVCI